MRILHIASFAGNIGDNASHIGLYNILNEILHIPFKIDRIEIRKFYKNYNLHDKQLFDANFATRANTYDLLIIGGGGFLDFWVPNSATGTTIDISKEVLSLITVPTIITSVGCHPHREIPEGNVEKFHAFLKQVDKKKNFEILLRNDGSSDVLKQYFDDEFCNIPTICDNGFFYSPNPTIPRITPNKYIAINTTIDQMLMSGKKMSLDDFQLVMREFIIDVIKTTDYDIVFVPHIYKDIEAYQQILIGVHDFIIRSRIIIAPYVQHEHGCDYLMSVYNNAEKILGMRYHACVCSISMGKNVLGLVALDRIKKMMDFVGYNGSYIHLDENFNKACLVKFIKNPSSYSNMSLSVMKQESIKKYKDILSKFSIL